MNPEIAKKAFPQLVINGLVGLALIFILALIYSLHANADESKETVLDWKAPEFMQKLTEQCPQLAPDILEIAQKFAKNAKDYRESYEQNVKRSLKHGKTDEEARKYADAFTFRLQVSLSSPWRKRESPFPPSDVPLNKWEEWGREQKRLKAERKQHFIAKLTEQCSPLPPDVLEHAYKETLIPDHRKNKKQ